MLIYGLVKTMEKICIIPLQASEVLGWGFCILCMPEILVSLFVVGFFHEIPIFLLKSTVLYIFSL